MKTILSDDVVHAPVCKIKPHLQASHIEQIESWLRDGVIAPADSPRGSPLVPVAKKDGSTQWGVVFSKSNKYMLPEA